MDRNSGVSGFLLQKYQAQAKVPPPPPPAAPAQPAPQPSDPPAPRPAPLPPLSSSPLPHPAPSSPARHGVAIDPRHGPPPQVDLSSTEDFNLRYGYAQDK